MRVQRRIKFDLGAHQVEHPESPLPRAFGVGDSEADSGPTRRIRRFDQLPQRQDDRPQLMVVLAHSSLELCELGRQLGLSDNPISKPQERSYGQRCSSEQRGDW